MFQKDLKKQIQRGLEEAFDTSIELKEIKLEPPSQKEYGDLATNIAFQFAEKLEMSPDNIAQSLAQQISDESFSVESKDGFVNFQFKDDSLVRQVQEILKFNTEEKENRMVLDYSAPNIAKSFGIGHLRSTIIGQAIYNIYEFEGWQAVGVNHLGDWGTQYGKLIYQIKKENKDPQKLSINDLEELYVQFHDQAKDNPEMVEKGKKWFKKLEQGDEEAKEIWKICVDKSLKEFKKTYNLLEVDIDYCLGESFYQDKMQPVIEEAKEKGVATKSEGALVVQFDEDIPPAMLLKSDGSTTYFTRDLATVRYRLDRWDPDRFIYEVGADQKLHLKQLFKTVEKLDWRQKEDFKHIAHGMYRLPEGAMSTREGKTIHLDDVLQKAIKKAETILEESETTGEMTETEKRDAAQKIGVGAVKYADLQKHYRKDILFDWSEIMNLQGNSGPYLQYTTLRAKSILEKYNKDFELQIHNLSEQERDILRKIMTFRKVTNTARKNYTPSSIAQFAYELAQNFNSFYNDQSVLEAKNKQIKLQRLSVTKASYEVLHKSLELLGISVPDKM